MKWLFVFLRDYKDAFGSIQAIVTCAAFVLGGFWTWIAFVRKRISFPIAHLSHEIHSCPINKTFNLLRVTVKIENKGEVLLKIGSAQAFLQQLSPCPPILLEALSQGEISILGESGEAEWPPVGRPLKIDYAVPHEIEPGESDVFPFDFFIPIEVTSVLVNTHIVNSAKQPRRKSASPQLGWNNFSIYSDFPDKETLCLTKNLN